jgi:hypothetical protein
LRLCADGNCRLSVVLFCNGVVKGIDLGGQACAGVGRCNSGVLGSTEKTCKQQGKGSNPC